MSAQSSFGYSQVPPPPHAGWADAGGERPNLAEWGRSSTGPDFRGDIRTDSRGNYDPRNGTPDMRGEARQPSTGGAARPSLPAIDPNPNLYIHNVPKDASEDELRDLFSAFGTVERIRLKVNQKIGPQALYAFVTFRTTAEAQLALHRLNGFDMRGRKLRVEFQRSRIGDEDRFYDARHDERPVGREGRGESHRRKRGGGAPSFDAPTGYEERPPYEQEGPSFKRARYFDTDRSGRGPGGPLRAGYEFERGGAPPRWNGAVAPERYPPSMLPAVGGAAPLAAGLRQAPLKARVLNLCDLVRRARPWLFASAQQQGPIRTQEVSRYPPSETSQPASMPGPISALQTTRTPPLSMRDPHQGVHASEGYQQDSRPDAVVHDMGIVGKAPLATPALSGPGAGPSGAVATTNGGGHEPGEVVWIGNLARNAKRKVPVEIVAVEGSISGFLDPDIQNVNISHRSSWEDVAKKPVGAICFIRLATEEIGDDGIRAPIPATKIDSYRKGFLDHVDYLTSKERAGVATLSERKQLYVIPPTVPLFGQLLKDVKPPGPGVLLGLLTDTGAATVSPASGPVVSSASTMDRQEPRPVFPHQPQQQAQQPIVQPTQGMRHQAVPPHVSQQPVQHQTNGQRHLQQPPPYQYQQQRTQQGPPQAPLLQQLAQHQPAQTHQTTPQQPPQVAPPHQGTSSDPQPPVQSAAAAGAGLNPSSLLQLLSNPQLLASLKSAAAAAAQHHQQP